MYHPLFQMIHKQKQCCHIFTLNRSVSRSLIETCFPEIRLTYIDCSDGDTIHSVQLDPHVLESPPKLLESVYIRLVHLCDVQASTENLRNALQHTEILLGTQVSQVIFHYFLNKCTFSCLQLFNLHKGVNISPCSKPNSFSLAIKNTQFFLAKVFNLYKRVKISPCSKPYSFALTIKATQIFLFSFFKE